MTCKDCIHERVCEKLCPRGMLPYQSSEYPAELFCKHFKNKADVIEIDKAAKVLAIVTGIAPCEMVSNEWLFDCCECIGYCGEISDVECWEQYLKHSKG